MGRLPLALNSVNHQEFYDPDSLHEALSCPATISQFQSLVPADKSRYWVGSLSLNQSILLSYAGTKASLFFENCTTYLLLICISGAFSLNSSRGGLVCTAGGAGLLPRGDRHFHGSSSVASIQVTPRAVQFAAAAMAGRSDQPLTTGQRFRHFPPMALTPGIHAARIHALLRYIDNCALAGPHVPGRLGLDDVIHRFVACLIDPGLLLEDPPDLSRFQERNGRSSFDDLIDYIRANLDKPLKLSDLEARSHYSRRTLQYAFRERLGMTPKQWIHHQRLKRAVEQLQRDGPRPSVQQVALACGFPTVGQFSRAFKQQFSITPSQARREW